MGTTLGSGLVCVIVSGVISIIMLQTFLPHAVPSVLKRAPAELKHAKLNHHGMIDTRELVTPVALLMYYPEVVTVMQTHTPRVGIGWRTGMDHSTCGAASCAGAVAS